MGISRSSTLVLAYLLTKNAPTTLEKELAFLRSKRNCVDPNDGFLKQLQIFQSSIISTSNTTYSSKKGKEIPSKPFTTDKNWEKFTLAVRQEWKENLCTISISAAVCYFSECMSLFYQAQLWDILATASSCLLAVHSPWVSWQDPWYLPRGLRIII